MRSHFVLVYEYEADKYNFLYVANCVDIFLLSFEGIFVTIGDDLENEFPYCLMNTSSPLTYD